MIKLSHTWPKDTAFHSNFASREEFHNHANLMVLKFSQATVLPTGIWWFENLGLICDPGGLVIFTENNVIHKDSGPAVLAFSSKYGDYVEDYWEYGEHIKTRYPRLERSWFHGDTSCISPYCPKGVFDTQSHFLKYADFQDVLRAYPLLIRESK